MNPIKKINKNNTIIRSKRNNIITKNKLKKSQKNIKINKKNPEDKDKTDLNSIGTKNKSLFKLKFLKHPKRSFQNPTVKNSKMNFINLRNLKTVFSNKEKNLLMSKSF